jgi:RimJ/RimL family protein N-acetyltransferase
MLTSRLATTEDAERLFHWVNAPDSLANKLKTREPIGWEEHCRWLADRLSADECVIRVLEHGDRDVGQLRLERHGDAYDVDIYVVPEARGQGIARQAIALGAREIFARDRTAVVRACVRIENVPSRRLFAAAGFTLTESLPDYVVFILRQEQACPRQTEET